MKFKVVMGIELIVLLIGMLTLIFSIQSVSSELSLPIESPHPYSYNYDNTWNVTIAGAIQMRIHFSIIETESNYDRVNLYDKNDSWVGEYWGTVHDTWSRWIPGDTIKVRLTSDGSYNYFGFIIDETETRDHIQTTPIALFRHMPVSPIFVNETIKFSAYGLSYDPDGNYIGGNLTAWEWDFGDGTNGTGSVVFHSYSSIGGYNVTLKVTDDDGETNSISKIINVSAVARNIALNPTRTGYPHPLESNDGWGGGRDKWDIVDGDFIYPGQWARGLAFTGGKYPYFGPAGWKQATINFGENKTFDRVRIWHHGKEHIPRVCKVQYWSGADWVDVFSTTSNAAQGRNESRSLGGFSWQILTDYWFNPVTSSKVRFTLDNHDIVHGWIWEIKVYEPVYYQLNVTSTPVTGITFTTNGTPKTTPYIEWLLEGTCTLEMPETHTVGEAKYYWNQWSDGVTTRSRTVTINTNITLTAQYTGPYYQLTFNLTLGEETYSITTLSISAITNFNFSQTLKQISFNVTGPTGTSGFCNVTIPDDLLWGEFAVYMDGSPLMKDVNYTQTYNGTHYIFYVTYTHTTHVIEIRGTEVIPEFPLWTSMLLILIVLTVAIAVYKRGPPKTPIH